MTARRVVLGALTVVGAHVVGSYGVELLDALNNYELEVPFVERLGAPVTALAWLIRASWAGRPYGDLNWFWGAYVTFSIGGGTLFAVAPTLLRKPSSERGTGFSAIVRGDGK